MDRVKYLLVGGGVSNLGFANFINDDDYLILEKEAIVGGYCRTIARNGFIWDYAGHFFHFANPVIKDFFEQKVPKDALISKEKRTFILYKNDWIDFPFQKNIHQLKKDEFIECLYDLFNKEEKEGYNSFKEMLIGKFGQSISDKFLIPYNEKLYACDLNHLDVDAMGRFFPYANKEEIIANFKKSDNQSYNSTFMYPKNGAKVFVDALLKDVDPDRILTNEKVVNIDRKAKIATTESGREIGFKYLINSSPFNVFVKMFGNDLDEYDLTPLTYNKVLVLNLGFNKKAVKDVHWIYIPEKQYNFYRLGFYDNILDQDRASMYVEIGFESEATINIKQELNQSLEGLKNLNLIDDSFELVDYESIVMSPAYVHVNGKANELKVKIKSLLEEEGMFSIGRYGDWKYCSIEDSITDALILASKFNSHSL